ncbi:MAG: glycosyltransferase family 2 protein [Promethearchaeota archaeon]
MNEHQLNLDQKINTYNTSTLNDLLYSNKKTESSNQLISVVIPLYNEENTIKNVIERIPNHQHYEIIIVDDGSTDDSIKKVKEINDRNIKIIKHKTNQGYGAAILTGMENSCGDYLITIDSDGQHNPEEIPNLLEPLINNTADLVIGSRYLGKCHYKMPLHARVGAYFINFFLRLLYLQEVYDNQCGFRAFRKDVGEKLNNMRYTDMGFSTEMLFKIAHYNYRIVERPISVNPRKYGNSYVNLIKIVRSITSCIVFYTLKKFNLDVNRFFLKRIVIYFFKKLKDKKVFRQVFFKF